jgi:hypothetical protein
MIKALVITASLSLAIGTIGGYYLQKMEAIGAASPSIQKTQTLAAQSTPAKSDEAIAANITQKTDRNALILKLSLCLNRKLNKAFIDSLSHKQLNDITFEACQS